MPQLCNATAECRGASSDDAANKALRCLSRARLAIYYVNLSPPPEMTRACQRQDLDCTAYVAPTNTWQFSRAPWLSHFSCDLRSRYGALALSLFCGTPQQTARFRYHTKGA